MEEQLFNQLKDILNDQGDVIEGDVHVIDTTDYNFENEVMNVRVYYLKDKIGYCFDVTKELIDEENNIFDYSFYTEWDGFDKIDVKKAIEITKNI